MRAKIEFDGNNAAFEDAMVHECISIMDQAKEKLIQLLHGGALCVRKNKYAQINTLPLLDSNGNTVGAVVVMVEEKK